MKKFSWLLAMSISASVAVVCRLSNCWAHRRKFGARSNSGRLLPV